MKNGFVCLAQLRGIFVHKLQFLGALFSLSDHSSMLDACFFALLYESVLKGKVNYNTRTEYVFKAAAIYAVMHPYHCQCSCLSLPQGLHIHYVILNMYTLHAIAF